MKWLGDNVGKNYMGDRMIPDHFCNTVWRIENHLSTWEQEFMINDLTDAEERDKAKNWNELSGEEREKYAPKPTRYTSGLKEKKVLGKKQVSQEGIQRLEEIKRNWKEGMANEVVRETMEEGWVEWSRRNRCCADHQPGK